MYNKTQELTLIDKYNTPHKTSSNANKTAFKFTSCHKKQLLTKQFSPVASCATGEN